MEFITNLVKIFLNISAILLTLNIEIAFGNEVERKANILAYDHGNYSVTLEKHPEIGLSADEFLVKTKNKEVFSDSGMINLVSGYDLTSIKNIEDFKKSKILVIESFSGGAHCCYSTTIAKLEKEFKIMLTIEGAHSPVKIEKTNSKDSFKIELYDWTYAYVWTSFANSSAPKVIFFYTDGKKTAAINKMRHKPLTDKELASILDKINSENYSKFEYTTIRGSQLPSLAGEKYFAKALQPVLDLIYSGNAAQAKVLIDKTWPGSLESKKSFLQDLQETLKKSIYYDMLLELNKPGKLDFTANN